MAKEFLVLTQHNQGIQTTKQAVNAADIPNLSQTQSMIEGRVSVKDSARLTTDAVSDGNLDLTTGGLLVIDGVQTVAGDRVLVRNQTNTAENGLYVVVDGGAWTRAEDADTDVELKAYTSVFVRQGTDHAGHEYVLAATTDPVVGTDGQTWIHRTTASSDAADVGFDDTGLTHVSGADVDAALTSVDTKLIDIYTGHAADIATVQGVFGIGGSDTDLGTFTGSTIADNTDVKTALQALETKVESNDDIYANSRYTGSSESLVDGIWKTITHNLAENYPSMIEVYNEANGKKITDTLEIEVVDANSIRVYQESGSNITATVVVRK